MAYIKDIATGGTMSPEETALRLLDIVADIEGKMLNQPEHGVDRAWVLSTYTECLKAVYAASKKHGSIPL